VSANLPIVLHVKDDGEVSERMSIACKGLCTEQVSSTSNKYGSPQRPRLVRTERATALDTQGASDRTSFGATARAANRHGDYPPSVKVKVKVKQSLYTPWRRLGGEEV
jgi:hypothetical protein